jgi:hypothetical protein
MTCHDGHHCIFRGNFEGWATTHAVLSVGRLSSSVSSPSVHLTVSLSSILRSLLWTLTRSHAMIPAIVDGGVVAASIESDWDVHISLPISGGDGKTSGVCSPYPPL